HEVLRLGMIGRAEAQRIHVGDRARAHGEHVAHDAADASRGALIGLDIGRVIVALYLEHGRQAVAEIDHARVLARPLNHLRALGRQLPEPDLRGFDEQCADHITEKMPSSVSDGSRPSAESSSLYSAALIPCSAAVSGVILSSAFAARAATFKGGAP